jgi:hypothetical protein
LLLVGTPARHQAALLTREAWGNSERAAVDQLIAASK